MTQTILIVEDEAFIRLLIQQTLEDLEDLGVRILSAEDGLEGWRLIQQEKPDLIFLDVMMPEMNGFEVCERTRALWGDAIYVVLLTAKGQDFDRQRGLEAGANTYMTKPFDPDELVNLAGEVLGVH